MLILIGKGIYRIIQSQIHQPTSGSYSDICDGDLYRDFGDNTGNFVTLTLNTDGIPVFNSSNYAFWPVYLFVNELPYRMR